MMRFGSLANLLKCRSPVTIQQKCGLKESVEAKLGLPEKPKRPLSAYLKYMSKVRPEIVAKNPNSHPKEIVKIGSNMWKSLNESTKKLFQDEYKQESDKFQAAMTKYNNSLTPEQKQEIKDAIEEIKEAKDRREARIAGSRRNKELGKPVKPVTSYLLFSLGLQQGRTSTSLGQFQAEVTKKWAALSKEEKQKYVDQAAKLKEDYEKRLLIWETKMIEQGNLDVVRQKTLEESLPKKEK